MTPPSTRTGGRLATAAVLAAAAGCNLFTAPGTELQVTVDLFDGASGAVLSDPVGIECGTNCAETFLFGHRVHLRAVPDAGSGFLGWAGACNGSESVCTLTMNKDRMVHASFGPVFELRVERLGAGHGFVTSSPGQVLCGTNCSDEFASGTIVRLTARPSDGSFFGGWTDACSGSARNCILAMTEPRDVGATFLLGHYLQVIKAGAGSGTVKSVPWGIDCGSLCVTNFLHDQVVTLVAEAAAGSVFSGWSGDCTGTADTCELGMTAARTVTAEFGRQQ